MGSFDVMTVLLVKLLGLDPLNVPVPVQLLGVTMIVMWITAVVYAVWALLRYVFATAADLFEVTSVRQKIVIARGLTRHDFEQVRKGIKAWKLLVVRYGSDDYLRHMAGEADRQAGRTRFDVVRMKLALSPVGEVTLAWSLPVHRRLGSQFRCYVDIRPDGAGAEVLTGMLRHYDEIELLPAETQDPRRVYFLLKRFTIITAADGMRQNFMLPQ
jgi:hypothetical protein